MLNDATIRKALGLTPCMKPIAFLALLLTASLEAHADWPRLRGPNGDGVAVDNKTPTTWSATEHLKWQRPLPGPGSSSPIVVGDKVFVTCWSGYGITTGDDMANLQRHLVCLSKTDGSIVWDKKVPAVLPEDQYGGMLTEHGYASSTPVSDGQSVFVFFGRSGALGFDLQGNQLWQTSLGTNGNNKHWGSASSPILYKDTVIVTAYDEGGAMVALDKKTGKQVWRSPAEGLNTVFTTPLIHGDDLLLPVAGELWSLNPDTGKLKWYALHSMTGNVSPCISVGDGVAFLTGGYPTQGMAAFKLGGKGDVTQANKVWSTNNASYIPSPIFYQGHLYVINDSGFAMCIDAKTGKDLWDRQRVLDGSASGNGGGPGRGAPGGGRRGGGKPFYASPVLVDGKLYCPSRKNGTIVLAAKPTYEKLAVNVIATDDSQCNASPAVDGNALYLRTDRALYRIE